MCGRYALREPDLAQELLDIRITPKFSARYNISPTQQIAVLCNDKPDEMMAARWGLIPPWTKSLKELKLSTINARSEDAAKSRLYASPLKKRRCLVFADGFYEWRAGENGKTPMFIHPTDQNVFAFAGLWSDWTDHATGEVIRSCSILTCDANSFMESIHNRMPVILPRESLRRWIEPGEVAPEAVQPLLTPYPADRMEAWAVSKIVNSPRNDLPECVVPAT
jgi:putative SOS response-associated peptidase YedK